MQIQYKGSCCPIIDVKENGHKLSDYTDSDVIFEEVKASVDELNNQFSNPEQLKKFSILPRDFTIDDGELTPTLKIRRKQINENWAEIIEKMSRNSIEAISFLGCGSWGGALGNVLSKKGIPVCLAQEPYYCQRA